MKTDFKDWLYLVGVAVTFGLFIWRLRVDRNYTKFRETINYLEKRDDKQNEIWALIKKLPQDSTNQHDLSEVSLDYFFTQLELVALLIEKGAFDEEIVYNQWWYFYIEPNNKMALYTWLGTRRSNDKTVYSHYLKRCELWKGRIEKEQRGL